MKKTYNKSSAKLVMFDLEEVYMLKLFSKSDGDDFIFPDEDPDDGGET